MNKKHIKNIWKYRFSAQGADPSSPSLGKFYFTRMKK